MKERGEKVRECGVICFTGKIDFSFQDGREGKRRVAYDLSLPTPS